MRPLFPLRTDVAFLALECDRIRPIAGRVGIFDINIAGIGRQIYEVLESGIIGGAFRKCAGGVNFERLAAISLVTLFTFFTGIAFVSGITFVSLFRLSGS